MIQNNVLLDKTLEQGDFFPLCQLVRSVFGEPITSLLMGKADLCGAQLLQNLLRGLLVKIHGVASFRLIWERLTGHCNSIFYKTPCALPQKKIGASPAKSPPSSGGKSPILCRILLYARMVKLQGIFPFLVLRLCKEVQIPRLSGLFCRLTCILSMISYLRTKSASGGRLPRAKKSHIL